MTQEPNTKGTMLTEEQLRNATNRFWSRVERAGECWLWIAGRTSAGYGMISIGNRHHYAHRIAWTLTNGPIPEGLSILHHCDTPACVNPAHLFLGTDADNMADRKAKGRPHGQHTHPESYPKGERVHTAKLTQDQVRYIRAQKTYRHQSVRSLADEFGVTRSAIKAIIAGTNWKESSL